MVGPESRQAQKCTQVPSFSVSVELLFGGWVASTSVLAYDCRSIYRWIGFGVNSYS